jgi:hypothetical protein
MRGMGRNIARAQRGGMQQRRCGRAEGWGCRKLRKPCGVVSWREVPRSLVPRGMERGTKKEKYGDFLASFLVSVYTNNYLFDEYADSYL